MDAYDRRERPQLSTGGPEAFARLAALVDAEAYVAVECTGFAHSERIPDDLPEGRDREDGLLTFAAAARAGRASFAERTASFVIDVATAREEWAIQPRPSESAALTPVTDIYEILGRASPALAEHIRLRSFKTLVEARTADFVGREFIFDAIDRLLHSDRLAPSGYVVIVGEPGIGKTSIMAKLVADRGYVHHFNVERANIRTARQFLANVCSQLIVRYGLDHRSLPPSATEDSGFLLRLLDEAAERVGGEHVIVAVDALDEAQSLYLPRSLPANVFFVVSTRPGAAYRHLDADRLEPIWIRDQDPENLSDVRRYVEEFVAKHDEAMGSAIAEWAIEPGAFVDLIVSLSHGNFMYLTHVLRDIRDGRLTAATVGDIRSLPHGLQAYYEWHWDAMQAGSDPDVYRRVVCHLAAAPEPYPAWKLAELTELSRGTINRVLREWRSFLDQSENDAGEPVYRIYHRSFQEFLRDVEGLEPYVERDVQAALAKIPGIGRESAPPAE